MSDLADKIREQATITGEMIIKADSRTGSTHMTDREEWGHLMAEQLAALSREVVLWLVDAEPPLCERYFLQGLSGPDMGKFVCESCGTVLGDLPIDEIDAAFEDHRNELHEKLVRLLGAAAERQMKRGAEMTQMLCGFCKGPLVLNWCPACEAIVEEDAQRCAGPAAERRKDAEG